MHALRLLLAGCSDDPVTLALRAKRLTGRTGTVAVVDDRIAHLRTAALPQILDAVLVGSVQRVLEVLYGSDVLLRNEQGCAVLRLAAVVRVRLVEVNEGQTDFAGEALGRIVLIHNEKLLFDK